MATGVLPVQRARPISSGVGWAGFVFDFAQGLNPNGSTFLFFLFFSFAHCVELAPLKKQIAHVIGAGGLFWRCIFLLLLYVILNCLEMIEFSGVTDFYSSGFDTSV